MSLINFGYRTDMVLAELPPIGGFLVGYDLDGVLKQKDHLGVITPIAGTGSRVALPTPKVSLVSGAANTNLPKYQDITWVTNSPLNIQTGTFSLHNYPIIIAEDFTQEQLDSGNIFVEMLHYRRKTSTTSKYHDTTGYVTAGVNYASWPSYIPWSHVHLSRNNSGNIGPGGIIMPIDRENFFPVSSTYEMIHVYNMLNGRFHEQDIKYRDIYNVEQILSALVPSVGYARAGRNRPSRRFPYSSYYTPYYICFRYIQYIPESNTIISGPVSKTVKITNITFPFLTDYQKSTAYNLPVCSIHPIFNKYRLTCAIENKLP